MCKCVEVARTVLLVYQPTQLPGGTMTCPEGAFYSPCPHTPCMTVHVYTSVSKLAMVYTVTKPKGRSTYVLLDRGRVITDVTGNHILP